MGSESIILNMDGANGLTKVTNTRRRTDKNKLHMYGNVKNVITCCNLRVSDGRAKGVQER